MLGAKTRSTLGRDLGGRLTPYSVAVGRDEPAGRADAAPPVCLHTKRVKLDPLNSGRRNP
jgi:hypothetical protein